MRVARNIEKVSVLVVIGVTENGQKQVIGIQSGDKNLLPVGGRPLRI
jgi:transposase-like protein